MTRQTAQLRTAQLRTRFARVYAATIIVAAMAAIGSVWANNSGPQAAIDVSALMQTIDTSRLPVQSNPDAI